MKCPTCKKDMVQFIGDWAKFGVPDLIIIGMEPGLKPAALLSKEKIVGVMATQFTLQSEKFKQLKNHLATETNVHFEEQACVGLVNQIEKGELRSIATLRLVRQFVTPLLQSGADTLVLRCTKRSLQS